MLKKELQEIKDKRHLSGRKPNIDKSYVIEQVNNKKSYSEVAKILNCSRAYIGKVIKQYRKENN